MYNNPDNKLENTYYVKFKMHVLIKSILNNNKKSGTNFEKLPRKQQKGNC